ncbi:MAG: tyrosine-type recombinase/integrase [Balneolaceae bacterium]
MPKTKLTHAFIGNVPPPTKPGSRIEYYDSIVEGLVLRITSTGHKSFSLRYGDDGKRFTIGKAQDFSLAEARDFAKDLKHKVRHGEDPQAEKIKNRQAPKAKKVSDLATLFKERHLPNLKESTRKDYERRINNFILPSLGKFEINDVERYHIIELLEDIAEGDTPAPIQSNRVRAIISSMYNFGLNRGIANTNPVQSIRPLGKENTRKRVYERHEIKVLWKTLDSTHEPFRSLFKMLLICGQRAGETRLMKWDHIQENIWTIPAENTKAKRTQVLPLPELALEILEDRKKDAQQSEYVFASLVNPNEPIGWLQKVASKVRKESKIKDFRLHDLRRTVATYMAELKVDRTTLGKVLNHKGLAGDNHVTAIYDRHDYLEEKKDALIKWETELALILQNE